MKCAWSRREREERRRDWLKKNTPRHKSPSPIASNQTIDRAQGVPPVLFEYYMGAFRWLNLQLHEKYPSGIDGGMSMRRAFWNLVPDGVYPLHEAQELINSYAQTVERRLAEEVRTHSFGYWIHIYRRFAPGLGPSATSVTAMLVRQRLEAAFQKYSMAGGDPAIGWSDELKLEEVLPSIPERYRLPKLIEAALKGSRKQLLTNFGLDNLVQLSKCEQLAHEIWKCGAMARIVSKGANLVVDHTDDECVFDNRSEELNTLVTHYDSRPMPFISSTTASVFQRPMEQVETKGMILAARYNVEREKAETYASLFANTGLSISPEVKFNFDWIPFDLKGYASAHSWLSEVFSRKHGFRFETALIILMALYRAMVFGWLKEPLYKLQAFNRAYTGPSRVADLKRIIEEDTEASARILDVELPSPSEIDAAVKFLALAEDKKALVSVMTGGPTFLFVPAGDGTVIVDFAWITANLQYLFLGLSLKERGAKGRLLEALVTNGISALPTGKCKGTDGTSKQVDAAFREGNTLVIVECKANARSVAYERGDLAALKYRRNAFEEALRQADEKAEWLSKHPKGTNYDISDIDAILPVVVTPFKEFIPSLDKWYWIAPEIPRVLMPHELRTLLNDPNLLSIVHQSRSTVFIPTLLGLARANVRAKTITTNNEDEVK